MGCDIHIYMEYGEQGRWSGDEIRVWRSYGLFTALAGVRRYNSTVESFELRGVPENASWETLDDYTLYISDIEGEDCCTQEQAESYIKYGSAYWGSDKKRVIHPDWHSASWLSLSEFKVAYKRFRDYYKQPILPDWEKYKNDHDGFLKECERLKDKTEPIALIPEVEGIIAFLEAMAKHDYETRVVF